MSQNGSGFEPGARPAGGERQPAFNAPWPALLLTAGLVALYALQRRAPDQEAVFYRYGLLPLTEGERARLVSFLFVHGNWAHVLLNALGALAFGAGVSRLFGTGPLGAGAFFAFYLVCGVLSGWGYMALKTDSAVVLIGASGAVAGLMGAASRVLDRQRLPPWARARARLAPFTSPTVISMAVAWLVLNLMVAVFGFSPGMGAAAVAWEAHLVGYAAGVLLVGPTLLVLDRLRGAEAIDPHS